MAESLSLPSTLDEIIQEVHKASTSACADISSAIGQNQEINLRECQITNNSLLINSYRQHVILAWRSYQVAESLSLPSTLDEKARGVHKASTSAFIDIQTAIKNTPDRIREST